MVRVTVVIPTYNRAEYLPRALDSVLAQTYKDYEVIIVDDCSTDETPDVVASYTDSRIRSFRQDRNREVSAARNVGIAHARGEYITFLDDDDELLPESLEVRVRAFDAAPADVGLVYAWTNVFNELDGSMRSGPRTTVEGYVFDHKLALNHLGATLDAMMRTSVVREVGCFDERCYYGEENLLVAQIVQRYRVVHVPQVVAVIYEHGKGRMSDADDTDAKWATYIRLHMKTFEVELSQRPKIRALLNMKLSYVERNVHGWGPVFRAMATSMGVSPFDTVSHVLGHLKRRFSSAYRSIVRD